MHPIPDLPIVGFVIDEVCSSSQLNLQLRAPHSTDNAVIRIAGRFVFQRLSDMPRQLAGDADGGDRSSLGICLNFYGSVVTGAKLYSSGALQLECHGGSLLDRRPWTLQVPPDDSFEAWEVEIHANKEIRVVGMPGGGLAEL